MSLHDKLDALQNTRLHDLLTAQAEALEQLRGQVASLSEKLAG